ncbi:ABC transporter substrate-binding protein [Steroidobacter cummioxidans]|uniref:ABC transporter substrate-binding protein n=1 Tax=Steroidobacter cummioxidans TaxID=1803913 RepID=UPI000E3185CD|nr:ABC transporter substrate-binding protein [Steroidobacter cummioxidans]
MDVEYERRQLAARRVLASLHIRAAILAMLCALGAYVPAAEDLPASAVVEKLQAALLDAMKNAKTLGTQGRYEKLKPVVEEVHDFAYILRAMLGSSASQLTPEQFKQAVAEFADGSARIYAHEFDNYSGQHFVTLEEKPGPRDTQVVRTAMQAPGNPDARFDYLLRQSDGRWRIVNTIAEGVSQLAMDRSQAQSALKQGGFDGLMAWIQGRVPKE